MDATLAAHLDGLDDLTLSAYPELTPSGRAAQGDEVVFEYLLKLRVRLADLFTIRTNGRLEVANGVYNEVFSLMKSFIGAEEATSTLTRQLKRCNVTADSMTKANIQDMERFLFGAALLYLHPDKLKAEALKQRLAALA